VLWQAEVRGPTAAQRLPGGHTLVVSTTAGTEVARPVREVVELDRAGRQVWKYVAPQDLAPVQATRAGVPEK